MKIIKIAFLQHEDFLETNIPMGKISNEHLKINNIKADFVFSGPEGSSEEIISLLIEDLDKKGYFCLMDKVKSINE